MTGGGRVAGGGIALVTGAGRGIGAAVVRALVADGYTVAATDREPAIVRTSRTRMFVLDVRDGAAVRDVVARVESEVGAIDVLVNVAGVLRTGPVVDTSDEDWDDVFDVDAAGVFRVSREVARRMVARRRGAVVTVASNSASVPRAHMAAYAAAKAAAAHFTRCLGVELAPYGIRCNVVSPGSTDTAMQRGLWDDPVTGAAGVVAGSPGLFKLGIPLGRIAEPEDVAAAVAFLVSERARHITMHTLTVDGGASLGV
ncbi:2,3-dihydro-2,3-dihydroxybenzoate dehydrogenase [Actinoplanes sp. RD1]|uniref:2,3-dihydro-2,3-dihydroxybenzoate dehydrogenase n=1 Tax=Actinoplanes sp. RD1 TaxID=3064538 RepID=UPI002741C3AC|nr:2,3-dihydro-2,3-dihydroxybenzoate dehydrogenase [Actinoplanes sp. RD1]